MFNITEKAATKIISVKEEENKPNLALKISVEGGGCSGFRYQIDFIDDLHTLNMNEFTRFEKNSAIVIIDNYSLENFVNNSTLDFIETLGSRYFDIKNPDASAKCGCGISFAI